MNEINFLKKSIFPESAPIACQGVRGAYSQVAADALFASPDILYMRTFDGVFRAVEQGLCKYGVLPIENSNAGSVAEVYDLMKSHSFYIVKRVKVSVTHILMAKKKIPVSNIKEVYTHEMAMRQCGRFLEQNSHIKCTPAPNTAKAAEFVANSERTDIAAIASANCLELYNLVGISDAVQNSANNFTRFICIGKEPELYEGASQMSIVLSLPHQAGSLYSVLKHFAEAGLNLTKLESRPITGSDFEFWFYLDIEGNIEDKSVRAALDAVKNIAREFVFLGNFVEITV